nr:hypothetical protein [Tanacetum cinerariifolium]
MNLTAASQIVLDNSLVPPEARLKIGECNRRIKFSKPQRAATYQVTLDALKLNCPKHSDQPFDIPPSTDEEIISFISELGYIGIIETLPELFMLNEDIMNSTAYKIYYAYASGAKEPKKARKFKKHASPKLKIVLVSPKEPTKKPGKAKKDGVSVWEGAEAVHLQAEETKLEYSRNIVTNSHETPSWRKIVSLTVLVKLASFTPLDKVKHLTYNKISSIDEGIGAKPGVSDVPKYDFEIEKESWGDSEEVHDDDTEDDNDNDGNDDDDSDYERTESDRDENSNLNQSDEFTDKEDDADNANDENKEKLDDGGADQHNVSQESGFEQEEKDAHVTLTAVHDTQKTEGPMQSSSVSSDFTKKLLNFENVSPADNRISSLMDTIVHHEEPSGQTSSLYTILVTVILEITSAFTTTIPPPHPSFNPLLQQSNTNSYTNSFRSNNLISRTSRLRIHRYIDNKLGEGIQQAIKSLTIECREEALTDKREYIDLIDISVRANIKDEANSQLPRILPQAVLEFATHVIERNITKSLEAVVLAKSSSQPKYTYEAAASLFEFELTKILIDKIEEHKSYLRVDYKRELYDALVKSYNTDKDLFDTYGEVFTLKRSRDDKNKDQDPSAGSDRGTKRRKSSKDAKSSRDPKSKESKSTSSSKGSSRSQHKSSGKSAHAEEPIHTVGDSRVQQNQEFDTGNNDEQLDDEAASKVDWFKKPKQPLTHDPNWNNRQHVDFRQPQTWISNITRVKNPPTSFDELIDTPIDFSVFVMNWLNITNLTQELLVGAAFNLLKYTCKSRTKLEYHFEECFKATTERLDWHNPEGKHPVKVVYDKHAYWSTSHLGPKRQQFYRFARNRMSSKDVYSRKRIIAVTKLKITKRYDYGHLDEIKVRREDQQLYKFKEGDFPRLRLQDINDLLLLLVQQKLTNLTIDEHFDLNVALHMFTRRIVIQRLVEDLQLVMNYVRTALHDITSGIRMEYLPKRKWSGLDKRRARVMIQDIENQLFQRRLMRNLKKFVGGREYEEDLRLLDRTI